MKAIYGEIRYSAGRPILPTERTTRRLFDAQEAGEGDRRLREIVAEGLQETYSEDGSCIALLDDHFSLIMGFSWFCHGVQRLVFAVPQAGRVVVARPIQPGGKQDERGSAMMTGRVKRAVAFGATAVALAGGVLVGTVGTASAEPQPGHHPQRHCHEVKGEWVRTWHPAGRDRHGKHHAGYWTRTFVPAHEVCTR